MLQGVFLNNLKIMFTERSLKVTFKLFLARMFLVISNNFSYSIYENKVK